MRFPLRIGAAAFSLALVVLTTRGVAQRAPIGDAIRDFVTIDAPVVALTNARVIDGTGAPGTRRPDASCCAKAASRR